MEENIRNEQTEQLFRAILTLSNVDDCARFFEDLCTVSEIQEMAKRLTAAKMLISNRIYSEISEETGLSTATISRVNRCLKFGNNGYREVLTRLERRR